MRNNLEICLSADELDKLASNIHIAFTCGASRVELCSAMHLDGLTPSIAAIKVARENMPHDGELLVMIRPISNLFEVDRALLSTMLEQIESAAKLGATGVVFGAISHGELDIKSTKTLVKHAQKYHLSVTFHRAFDCIENWQDALNLFIELGINRVLTNGTKWLSNTSVMQNLQHLKTQINFADNRIEVVIGGGVTCDNAAKLWRIATRNNNQVSLHAHSAVYKQGGYLNPLAVQALANVTGKKNDV